MERIHTATNPMRLVPPKRKSKKLKDVRLASTVGSEG